MVAPQSRASSERPAAGNRYCWLSVSKSLGTVINRTWIRRILCQPSTSRSTPLQKLKVFPSPCPLPMEREFLASFSIDQRARAPQRSPRPPGEGAPERGAGAPILGDATVAAHISTRAIAALHPAPGSHPSTIRLEPAPPSAGAGVREQRFCVVREK